MTPEEQITQLRNEVNSLKGDYYSGNFSSSQDFNKSCNFNARLKVPHFSSTPATGVVGEIIEVGGKLYVCSSANTWTVVGTQS